MCTQHACRHVYVAWTVYPELNNIFMHLLKSKRALSLPAMLSDRSRGLPLEERHAIRTNLGFMFI